MVETKKKRVLTGIKPTGVPHIGNYLGAIQPALSLADKYDAFLFIADLHALTGRQDPAKLTEDTYSVAATWLACGLDPSRVTFYKQSDIPEIPILSWILSCFAPVGLLLRAHSFVEELQKRGSAEKERQRIREEIAGLNTKVARDLETFESSTDPALAQIREEHERRAAAEELGGINHGVLTYPVLMAADILLFDTDVVPVGKDQKQHLEITQELARKLNLAWGDVLHIPSPQIDEAVMTVPGLDGRKMSKSYNNTIEIFSSDKELESKVKSIVTNSTVYGERLEPETIFGLYKLFATPEQTAKMLAQYESGRRDPGQPDSAFPDPKKNYFGWGQAKQALVEVLLDRLGPARREYAKLMADKPYIRKLLQEGAEKARAIAGVTLGRVMDAAGLVR